MFGGSCQRPYWSPDKWQQWLFPHPMMQLHLNRRSVVGQAGPAHSEAMLVIPYHCPLFHMPWHSFQEYLFYDLPQHRGVANTSVIPWVILSILLKNGCNIVFFQWPETSPDHHDFSNTIKSGNYISQFPQESGMHLIGTHRLTDVWVPQVVVILIFTYILGDSAPPVPTFWTICSSVWRAVTSEDRSKQVEYLSLLLVHCTDCISHKGEYTFLDFPFLVDVSVKAFLILLWSPYQVQFQLGLGLPDPIPTQFSYFLILLKYSLSSKTIKIVVHNYGIQLTLKVKDPCTFFSSYKS